MTFHNFTRRGMLSRFGMAAGSQMLPSLLGRQQARAATIPTRIIFFYSFQGTYKSVWAPSGSETDMQLGELHGPLNDYKKDLIFLNGVDMVSAEVDPREGSNAHYAGSTHAMTAINRASGTAAGGQSIDQFIAKGLSAAGVKSQVPLLGMAIEGEPGGGITSFSGGEDNISWTGPGQVQALDSNVSRLYTKLFPGTAPPPMNTSAADAIKAANARHKRSVDAAMAEFKAITPRMSPEDRMKLEAHMQNLMDVRDRIDSASTGVQGCTAPSKATIVDPLNANLSFDQRWNLRGDIVPKLAASALACDLTRVITIGISENGSVAGYSGGQFGTPDFHALVHDTAEGSKQSGNAAAVMPVKRYYVTLAQKFAGLVAALKNITEADGKSVLDHTVVLWCGQIGSGNHDLRRMPYILAGSAGGYFKTGRHIKYAPVGGKGMPHNNLFVSLANAMGLATTTFGNPSVCTGALPGLRA